MLPDAERLRKSGLFQRVFTARRSVSSEYASLFVLPRQSRSNRRPPLAGFVISKKILSKACERNRAKRRFRDAYKLVRRERQDSSIVQDRQSDWQWYAIVWVIQAKALEAEFGELVKAVRHSLQRADQKYGAKRPSS